MDKLSAEQQQAVLSEVPGVLRKLASERDFYKTRCEELDSRARVTKLASAMIDKGIKSGDVRAIADELEKDAADGSLDLAVTEAAVDFYGTDMSKKAHVNDEISGSSGGSELERFVLS